jgi:Domain of unknown function (DUF4747)
MAANETIEYCALNISASPHPEGVYLNIFERATKNKVNFWGDHFAAISEIEKVSEGFYRGRLVVWTEIDTTESAVKIDELERVDFADLGISLPNNVGFNGKVFVFIFRESDHILFLETRNDLAKTLSPSRAQRIFGELFSIEIQGVGSPYVEVTVIPSEDTLARILGISNLKRLHIHIVRPNADDIDPQAVLDGLVEQGARSQDITYIAAPQSGGLKPNGRTTTQAEVAQFNGFVEGTGYEDDGTHVALSTRQYPRIIKRRLGEFGTVFDAALAVARDTILRITGQ